MQLTQPSTSGCTKSRQKHMQFVVGLINSSSCYLGYERGGVINLWISSYGVGLWQAARTTAKFWAPAAMTDGNRFRSMPPMATAGCDVRIVIDDEKRIRSRSDASDFVRLAENLFPRSMLHAQLDDLDARFYCCLCAFCVADYGGLSSQDKNQNLS